MSKCVVAFEPLGKSVEVEIGTVLLDAARKADLEIPIPCGGQGRCGRCKVLVEHGAVDQPSTVYLSAEELEQGYVQACQAVVEGNAVIFVPPRAVIERVVSVEKAPEEVTLPVECDWRGEPTISKFFLDIEPPSLADQTSDLDRLKRGLAKRYGIDDITVNLPLLRRIAPTLRQADWQVTAVLDVGHWGLEDHVPPRLIDLVPGDRTDRSLGIAVDIGTTTNVVYLVDLLSGEVIDIASAYNGQTSCGEDVISRIIYSEKKEDGLQHLQSLVVKTINSLLAELSHRHEIDLQEINRMTVAGNEVMIHLFLALPPESIRYEPYIPTVTHPLLVTAEEIGIRINPQATVDCLPGVGAYVGADITAGVLSSGLFATDKLTVFLDVGTNGEIVLGNADWMIACACSAGPAFEGFGVEDGMMASTGAIEEVLINSNTREPTYGTIGNAPPKGICGSGLISLLAEMFITGVIDKAGKVNLDLDAPRVREGKHGPEYVVAWGDETETGKDIVITEVDIANLMRAKAAVRAGISVLLRNVGLNIADIEQVLIGGAFGKHINIEKAIQIGLLPDMPWDRFKFLGNTSILGAYSALLCRDVRRMVYDIAQKMTYLELSADNTFFDEFNAALFLPHTDLSQYPSVMRLLREQGVAVSSVSI
ncbi:MAG: ASKHA domain-containing protein [Anaerolineae bacterium]